MSLSAWHVRGYRPRLAARLEVLTARRKRAPPASSLVPIDPALVLVGDVRQAPIQVRGGGRIFSPDVALLVRAEDGWVSESLIAEPGQPGQTLVQALLQTLLKPGSSDRPALPGRLILFHQQLADEVRAIVTPLNVEVLVAPPFAPFDEVFADLFAYLERSQAATLDLPDDVLKPLVAAAVRLWRTKLWEYTYDEPPFALVPRHPGGHLLYAIVIGANGEALGVALYTSIEDYESTLLLGESTVATPPGSTLPGLADEARSVLDAIHHRTYLVTFEPKDEVKSAYIEQVVRCEWPEQPDIVSAFTTVKDGQVGDNLTAEGAADIAMAIDGREPGERSACVRLNRLNLHPRQRILYTFGFGDEWRHDVRLENAALAPDDGEYPRIVEECGTPPPQYPYWDEDDEENPDDGEDTT